MTDNRNDQQPRGVRAGSGPAARQNEQTELAPRMDCRFSCSNGHASVVTFAADITVPDMWPCTTCGRIAVAEGAATCAEGPRAEVVNAQSALREVLGRRTPEEGERLLALSLAKLEAERKAGLHPPHPTA